MFELLVQDYVSVQRVVLVLKVFLRGHEQYIYIICRPGGPY